VTGGATWEWHFDNPTRETVRRDRLVTAWMPTVWFNDFGGVTVGVRQRSNYFGTYDQSMLLGSVATGSDATDRVGVYFRITDPVGRPTPGALHVCRVGCGGKGGGRGGARSLTAPARELRG
jgi:hypothetical protein